MAYVSTEVADGVATITLSRPPANAFDLAVSTELHDAIQFLPGWTEARQLLVKRALDFVDRLAREAKSGACSTRQRAVARCGRLAEGDRAKLKQCG